MDIITKVHMKQLNNYPLTTSLEINILIPMGPILLLKNIILYDI